MSDFIEIETKEDALEQIQRLQGIASKFKFSADELNLIRDKINKLYELLQIVDGGGTIVTQESRVITVKVSDQTKADAVTNFNALSPVLIQDISSVLIKAIDYEVNFSGTGFVLSTTRVYKLISKPLNDSQLTAGNYGQGTGVTINENHLELLNEQKSSSQDIEEIANEVIDLGNIDPNGIVTHINTVLSPDKTIADSANSVTLIKSVQGGNQTDYIYIGSGGTYGANSSTNIALSDLQLVEQETSGGVLSVTGDSVDNTDPDNPVVNAIPLSGTELGDPVTGNIEINNDVEIVKLFTGILLKDEFSSGGDGFKSIALKKDSGNVQHSIGFTQFQGGEITYFDSANDILRFVDSSQIFYSKNSEITRIIVKEDFVRVSGNNNSNFKGLTGLNYYGANYDDLTYIQKKYVDDNFNNSSGLEQIDDGNGIGLARIGRDPDNYGDIGENAVDLSISDNPSSTKGATGNASTAQGGSTTASGNASHAEGKESTASGKNSHAEGTINFARSEGEHSGGTYGTDYTPQNDDEDRLVNYGNGTNNSNRSDAFTIFKNGAVRIFRATLASIQNTVKEGFLIFNSSDNNRPYIHNGTEWKGLAYEGNEIHKDLTATGNISFSPKEKKVSFLKLTGDIVIDYTDNPPTGAAYTVYNRLDYQGTARSVSLPVTATPANTKIAGDTLGNNPNKIYGVTSIIHNVGGTIYMEHIVNKF